MNNRNKRSDPDSELYSAILKLQTVEECYDFFTDLCASSATISRVNRSLNYGMGAYRIIFDRMKEDEQKQQEEPQA